MKVWLEHAYLLRFAHKIVHKPPHKAANIAFLGIEKKSMQVLQFLTAQFVGSLLIERNETFSIACHRYGVHKMFRHILNLMVCNQTTHFADLFRNCRRISVEGNCSLHTKRI